MGLIEASAPLTAPVQGYRYQVVWPVIVAIALGQALGQQIGKYLARRQLASMFEGANQLVDGCLVRRKRFAAVEMKSPGTAMATGNYVYGAGEGTVLAACPRLAERGFAACTQVDIAFGAVRTEHAAAGQERVLYVF